MNQLGEMVQKDTLFLEVVAFIQNLQNQPIKEEELLSKQSEPTNEWYAIAKIAGIKLCAALRNNIFF